SPFLITEQNRARGSSFNREACPLIRNCLSAESPQHISFGSGQSRRGRSPLHKMHIEALHQIERRTVFDLPNGRYDASGARQKECSRKVCDTLLTLERTNGSIAGGEHDEVCIQMQLHNLRCL